MSTQTFTIDKETRERARDILNRMDPVTEELKETLRASVGDELLLLLTERFGLERGKRNLFALALICAGGEPRTTAIPMRSQTGAYLVFERTEAGIKVSIGTRGTGAQYPNREVTNLVRAFRQALNTEPRILPLDEG